MKKQPIIIYTTLGIIFFIFLIWFVVNPSHAFGYSRFGFTIYNKTPYIGSDLQINSDLELKKIEKTHDLKFEQIEWLLNSNPEVLIISTGWDEKVIPDDQIKNFKDEKTEIKILPSEEAKNLYNKLKEEGTNVSIHYHSTC